jgi:hypothetical protein
VSRVNQVVVEHTGHCRVDSLGFQGSPQASATLSQSNRVAMMYRTMLW